MLELIQELGSLPGEEVPRKDSKRALTVVEFYRGAFERVMEILKVGL
jgi:hypothetical protein